MASFLQHLETIGADILKGIQIAGPIVGTFVPAAGPILAEVAAVITALEQKGQAVSPNDIATLVNAIATVHTVKQSAAATT